jgi:polyhydroxyalkanoate synthesis repressor PhaR
MAGTKKGSDKPVVIKKYANRRLYDTGRSSYVTLDDLCQMIKDGYEFVVYDAKSGEDLTRSVLTQIIVEQENKGEQNLLPTNFLRQLIGFYGDNVGTLVPNYLEQAFSVFTKNQDQFREQFKDLNKSFGSMGQLSHMVPPNMQSQMKVFEDMAKQNMAIFETAMQNALKAFSNLQPPTDKK